MSLPRHQFGAHQLAVGHLIGAVELDQSGPGAGVAKQFDLTQAQTLPAWDCPVLVDGVRQQVSGIGRGCVNARRRLAGCQRRVGEPFEAGGVNFDPRSGEQHDPAAAEHDSVLVAKSLPGMVGGLTQIGRAGVGVEVRPQRLDRRLAEQHLAVGQGEQLYQFGRTPGGPRVRRDDVIPDLNSEPAQHVDAYCRVLRHLLIVPAGASSIRRTALQSGEPRCWPGDDRPPLGAASLHASSAARELHESKSGGLRAISTATRSVRWAEPDRTQLQAFKPTCQQRI